MVLIYRREWFLMMMHDNDPHSVASLRVGVNERATGASTIVASDRQAPSTGSVVVTALVLLALASLPFLIASQPPLIDYPAHLARLSIINQIQHGGPSAIYYHFSSAIVPNLLFDIVGSLLTTIFQTEYVGRVYIIGTLVLQVFGTIALHRTLHRQNSYWPLLTVLFLYNWVFFYGFLGYLAGVGLALLSLALWLFLEHRPPPLRLAAGSIAAVLLFLSHIVPFIIYAVAVAGFELQWAASTRRPVEVVIGRLSIGAAQFLAPTLLFLHTPTAELASKSVAYWPEAKLASLLTTMTSGSSILDMWLIAGLGVVLALAVGSIRVKFAQRFGLAMVFALIAFVVMPWGLGPAVWLDARMPLALAFLAVAATDVNVRREKGRLPLVAAMAIIFVARVASTTFQTSQFSDVWHAYQVAFDQLVPGSILFVGLDEYCPGSQKGCACETCRDGLGIPVINELRDLLDPTFYVWRLTLPPHISSIAAINRDVFVPMTFAEPGLQSIVVRKELQPLTQLQDNISVKSPDQLRSTEEALEMAVEKVLPERSTYLLLQHLAGSAKMDPADATVVASGPHFDLLRLNGHTERERKASSASSAELARPY